MGLGDYALNEKAAPVKRPLSREKHNKNLKDIQFRFKRTFDSRVYGLF